MGELEWRRRGGGYTLSGEERSVWEGLREGERRNERRNEKKKLRKKGRKKYMSEKIFSVKNGRIFFSL